MNDKRPWLIAALITVIAVFLSWLIDRYVGDPARVVSLVLIGAAVAGIGFWRIPKMQAEAAFRRDNKKSFFELENDARGTLAQAIGGLFLVVGLAVTWSQLTDARNEQQATADRAATEQALSREGQITDRYTNAINQLGASDANGDPRLEIRLGGIYALERIARDSPADQGPIMEILTAYVRSRAQWNEGDAIRGDTVDIRAVMTVIGRRDTAYDVSDQCLDLNLTNLNQASLPGADLRNVCMSYSTLFSADLSNANLSGANLSHSHLTGANLSDADLTGADLNGSTLDEVISGGIIGVPKSLPDDWKLVNGYLIGDRAKIDGAQLQGSELSGVTLTWVDLNYANLSGANLSGANLDGASLIGSALTGANLSGAVLTNAKLARVTSGGIVGSPESLPDRWAIVIGYLVGPGANLSGADLGGAVLAGIDLSEGSMGDTIVVPTDLTNADLTNADVTGTDFTGAIWSNTICPDGTNSDSHSQTCDNNLSTSKGV